MNIRNIEAFIYVYHLSSFNQAADALYITQPTISARIKTLENELNAILFYRGGRDITLTNEGKVFLPYAYRIFNTYKKAKISMGQELRNLNIGSIFSVSTSLLPQLITTFKEDYPDVSVNIITGTTKEILNKIIDKQCHFGITESITDSRLNNLSFCIDPVSLVVPPNHPFLTLDRKATIEDIAFEPLITISHGVHNKNIIENIFHEHNMKPHIVMEVDNIETIKFMILKGLGISFLPQLCLINEIASGDLYTIAMDPELELKRKIEIIYLKGTKPPFINFFV